MTRPSRPTPPTWNPGRLLESLAYFDVLPFSDTMRWLQSLWSGAPTANSSMLFSASAIQPRRSILAVIDPSRSLLSQLAPLTELGLTLLDLTETSIETLGDRDQLIGLIIHTEHNLLNHVANTRKAVERLNADLAPQVIFDFCRDDSDLRTLWGSVDDVVMGGVSESQAIATASGMVFSGMVSTANSGGFASIRTRSIAPALDLRGLAPSDTHPERLPIQAATMLTPMPIVRANTGIELRLTGDGNRYKFILRDRDRWDGIAHCYSFETQPDRPITVRIPFADCVPTFRAKSVPDCPRLDGSTIAAFQFMLSKFEYDQRLNPSFEAGAFRLLIQSIAAYRAVVFAPIILVGESNAIALTRSALGDHLADLELDQLDLNTAITTIPDTPTPRLDAIMRHLRNVV